ncbi:MAG: phytoene/squalene synthase family protein, partial [Bacteroidetes bacterium]|nr:phytoene/squalene synthase family protein [Bacteroidota bacterium]
NAKAAIEADIEKDFKEAYQGILNLPVGARMGVLLAYKYYQRLFEKIKRLNVEVVKNERVRVPNGKKLVLLAETYFKYRLNLL